MAGEYLTTAEEIREMLERVLGADTRDGEPAAEIAAEDLAWFADIAGL
jgi:hypothetical protein